MTSSKITNWLTEVEYQQVYLQENHIKQEIESKCPKKQEVGDKPPKLVMLEYKVWVKVDLEW